MSVLSLRLDFETFEAVSCPVNPPFWTSRKPQERQKSPEGRVGKKVLNRQKHVAEMTSKPNAAGLRKSLFSYVKGKVLELPGIDDAEVEIVWDPPWTQDLISEEGKMELGLI